MGRKSGSRVSVNSTSIQSRQPGSSNIRKSIRCRKNEVSSLGDYPHSHQKHVSSGIISSRTKSGDKPKRQQNWRGSIFKNESVLNAILGLLLGTAYFLLVSKHFQTLTNFATLTNLEKELSLPSETAFRYSFFKRICGRDSDSLLKGIRSVIYDNGSDVNQETGFMTNSLQKYGLIPEIILGAGFHVASKFLGPKCWLGPSSSVQWSEQLCSGLGDPLTFFLTTYWVLNSIIVVLVVIAGSRLSGSKMGGILAGATFLLNHAVTLDWTTLFPIGDCFGLVVASVHILSLPHFVIMPLHSSWTTVVKMSLLTALLGILWPMEAQWVLVVELGAVLSLHFCNMVSPYLVLVVLGGHIVGWEYSSLVTLDPSLRCWTFYLYLVLGGVGVTWGVRRVIDYLLGTNLEKKLLLRATILSVGLYLFVTEARHGILTVTSFQEDFRMSQHLHQYGTNRTSNSTSWSGAVAATLSSEEDSLELQIFEEDNDSPWLLSVNPNLMRGSSSQEGGWNSGESLSGSQNHELKTQLTLGDDPIISEKAKPAFLSELGTFGEANSNSHKLGDEVRIKLKNKTDYNASAAGSHLHLNELNAYLRQCLASSSPSLWGGLEQLLTNHATPIVLALGLLASFHKKQRNSRKTEKETGGRPDAKSSSSQEEAKLFQSVHFHALCFLTFSFLSVSVHDKFKILGLVHLSLFPALLMSQDVDDPDFSAPEETLEPSYYFYWRWIKRHSVSYGIAIVAVGIMMTFARSRINFVYESRQQILQGDTTSGKEELVQVMKWIGNETPTNALFLGPSYLMANVYCGGRGVRNHKEVNLSQWTAELFQLFNTHLPMTHLCQELKLNGTHSYLLLSKDFCLNPFFYRDKFPLGSQGLRSGTDISPDVDNCTCNLTTFWDKIHENHPKDRIGNGRTPCIRLLSGTLGEIKPFRRIFRNRLYSIVTCS